MGPVKGHYIANKTAAKVLKACFFGPPFFRMCKGTLKFVTVANIQVIFINILKCLKIPLLIVKILMFWALTS